MKNVLKITLVAIFVSTIGLSQDFNSIPYDNEISTLSNGWYKFSLQGVTFDVEILQGRYQQGNIKWFDGSTYSGRLSGTNFSGKGTYTWSNGSKYEGSFKKHQRHGKGSLTLNDGTKWYGKWKNNQKNGQGSTYDAEGMLVESGVWDNGNLQN